MNTECNQQRKEILHIWVVLLSVILSFCFVLFTISLFDCCNFAISFSDLQSFCLTSFCSASFLSLLSLSLSLTNSLIPSISYSLSHSPPLSLLPLSLSLSFSCLYLTSAFLPFPSILLLFSPSPWEPHKYLIRIASITSTKEQNKRKDGEYSVRPQEEPGSWWFEKISKI